MDTDTAVNTLGETRKCCDLLYSTKPERPSHANHSYIMAGLRFVLSVEVHAGNEHPAKHTQSGLIKMLDGLSASRRPKLIRNDSTFGNDSIMTVLEERKQPYMFKLKLTKNVKRHIARSGPKNLLPFDGPAGR